MIIIDDISMGSKGQEKLRDHETYPHMLLAVPHEIGIKLTEATPGESIPIPIFLIALFKEPPEQEEVMAFYLMVFQIDPSLNSETVMVVTAPDSFRSTLIRNIGESPSSLLH